MKWLIGAALAMSLTLGGTGAHAQSIDSKADLEKAAGDWMNAYNKKDAATVAQVYTDEAVVSGPGWTASGRAAILEALNKDLAAGVFSRVNSITVDQSHRIGDMNYAAGAWTADMKGPDGRDIPVGGHWLAVSKYTGGQYSMMLHNINMAMPPPSK
jgi:ketosteroid isomerase-like protein